jgi:branched-chain amino acid transport system ATP-binding protein
MRSTPALQVQNMGYRIGDTEILRPMDLTIAPGERVALIGPNGAGKTTLFNLISGRQRPTRGGIFLNGQTIAGCTPSELHQRGLARSFQITHLFPNLTVLDNMRCALMRSFNIGLCFWRALSKHAALEEKTQLLLTQLQLTAHQNILVKHLSYADQRTLELGLALAADSTLLLLDEPTAGMSHSESRHVVKLIRGMTEGKTLLLVEHDMGVVFDLADRIVVLVDGRMVANDTPEAIRRNPLVRAAYLGSAQPEVP